MLRKCIFNYIKRICYYNLLLCNCKQVAQTLFLHSIFAYDIIDWFAFEQTKIHSCARSLVNVRLLTLFSFYFIQYLSIFFHLSCSTRGHITKLSKLFAATSTKCTEADEFLANTLSRGLGYADSEISWCLKHPQRFTMNNIWTEYIIIIIKYQ